MSALLFRRATEADLPDIIALLADDILGKQREVLTSPPDARYTAAFRAIDSNPNQQQVVATLDNAVVGTLQLTFIPGLARTGAWRGQIEGVRVAAKHRSDGVGRQMFHWAIEQCRHKGCHLVQLTTDRERPDAHRFYESLGFTASHLGYKLTL